MNLFTPTQMLENYAAAAKPRMQRGLLQLFLLSFFAGLCIAFGAAATNTAAHAIQNVGLARMVCGLLFPFGLGIVMLTGSELFTGNSLLVVPLLGRQISAGSMLRNWLVVYLGNFVGSVALAAGCAFTGQLGYSQGGLAVFTIRMAAAKCALPFSSAFVLGIFCNVLVCAGVLCGLCGKDAFGRIAGAYIPVAFFVICGFEHCVANMFYIPAGLFAMQVPAYAQAAAAAGVDTAALTTGGFLLGNLLPVTLGNIVGGGALGALMWLCHRQPGDTKG